MGTRPDKKHPDRIVPEAERKHAGSDSIRPGREYGKGEAEGGLSVIVPFYNTGAYLRRCVESIIGQTRPPQELILVDDGSTDESGEIAEALAREYECIRIIHQENNGAAGARNAGMEAAACEYITFVDSDDYIGDRMYETMLSMIYETGADIAICGMTVLYPDGSVYYPYKKGVRRVWGRIQALVELNSYRYFNMSFCTAVFRRRLFEKDENGVSRLRFPVGRNSEDFFLMHRVIARADRVAYSSEPLYFYYQRPESASRNSREDLSLIEAAAEQSDFYRKYYPEIAYAAETAYVFAHIQTYSSYLRRGVTCPPALVSAAHEAVDRHLLSLLRNPSLPLVKKVQALVFCYLPWLYNLIIKRKLHR